MFCRSTDCSVCATGVACTEGKEHFCTPDVGFEDSHIVTLPGLRAPECEVQAQPVLLFELAVEQAETAGKSTL